MARKSTFINIYQESISEKEGNLEYNKDFQSFIICL